MIRVVAILLAVVLIFELSLTAIWLHSILRVRRLKKTSHNAMMLNILRKYSRSAPEKQEDKTKQKGPAQLQDLPQYARLFRR